MRDPLYETKVEAGAVALARLHAFRPFAQMPIALQEQFRKRSRLVMEAAAEVDRLQEMMTRELAKNPAQLLAAE